MNFRKILLRVMLVSLGVAAVVGALAMLLFNHGIVWRIVGTTVTTAVAAGLMLVLIPLNSLLYGAVSTAIFLMIRRFVRVTAR